MAGNHPIPTMNGTNRFIRTKNQDFPYHSLPPHPSKANVSLYDSTYEQRDFRDTSPFGTNSIRDCSPFPATIRHEPHPYSQSVSRETSPYLPREARGPSPYYTPAPGGLNRFPVRDVRDTSPYRADLHRDVSPFSVRDAHDLAMFRGRDRPPLTTNDNFDRRIAVVNAVPQTPETLDKRIAVHGPNLNREIFTPPRDPKRSTAGLPNVNDEQKFQKRGDYSHNPKSSAATRLGPETPTEKSFPNYYNQERVKIDEKDSEKASRERYELEKKKELQRLRRLHRQKKQESKSDDQKTAEKSKQDDSDTDLEDERPVTPNNQDRKTKHRKRSESRSSHGSHKKRSESISSYGSHRRKRSISNSSHEGRSKRGGSKSREKYGDLKSTERQRDSKSNEKFKASPVKIPKQSPDSKYKSDSATVYSDSPRSSKSSPRKYTPRKSHLPQLEDETSLDTTVEEGELKSSASSQCDDTDIPKNKLDFDKTLTNESISVEDLRLRNSELENQIKQLQSELMTEKRGVERLVKDQDIKIENLEEFYQDELESLRKENAYLKKENDRERDMTDLAKAKERDLLNKVRRLEDSLLHSGKENLDLQEKLKRMREENDSFRYGSYPRFPPAVGPTPGPPATSTFRYQPPSWQ